VIPPEFLTEARQMVMDLPVMRAEMEVAMEAAPIIGIN
jgi:hypothetical protein